VNVGNSDWSQAPTVGVIKWPPARAMTIDNIEGFADLVQPVE